VNKANDVRGLLSRSLDEPEDGTDPRPPSVTIEEFDKAAHEHPGSIEDGLSAGDSIK
jgi:hypothetical protein